MRKQQEDRDLAWELISEEHIEKDQWIDFRRVAYRLPDGSVWEPYYTYSRKNYVVIVAETEDGKFLCVHQYRQGIGKVTVEFPAGGIETALEDRPQDWREAQAQEIALAAAKRELMEETGYTSEDWSFLMAVPGNATIADNYAYLYYAKNCRKVSDLHLDEMEFLEPELYSTEEIETMIKDGAFA